MKGKMTLVPAECARANYHTARDAVRASMRAIRWMRNRGGQGQQPPRHIKEKLRLFKPVYD